MESISPSPVLIAYLYYFTSLKLQTNSCSRAQNPAAAKARVTRDTNLQFYYYLL